LYQCGDGRWVHLHGAFPRLAERTVRVLGLPDDPDRETIAKAVAQWDAPALEDALAEIGTCGALVRTNEEWQAHPQGHAVGAMALGRCVIWPRRPTCSARATAVAPSIGGDSGRRSWRRSGPGSCTSPSTATATPGRGGSGRAGSSWPSRSPAWPRPRVRPVHRP